MNYFAVFVLTVMLALAELFMPVPTVDYEEPESATGSVVIIW